MARSWTSSLALVFGGLGCVSIGALLGSRLQPAKDVLWHEAPAITVQQTVAAVPSFRSVVERAGPSVVTVRAWLPQDPEAALPEDANELPSRRSGSGFVIQRDGLVLTSRHVVVDALSVEVHVQHHGRFVAELVGEDRATDLALLRLVEAPEGLSVLPLGGSEDLAAGDWIVTVGNSLGFSRTVTAGVVSFVGRHLPHSDFGVSNDFLQISAPVNPGSSGCPVLDIHGRVVGVSTKVAAAAQGIAFAVPSRSIKWALQAMQRQPDGRVRRGYLGIAFAPRPGLDEEGVPKEGALIVRVADGEPGATAGLQEGDVVLRVDGSPIRDPKDLHERIVRSDPGTPMALQLLRDGLLQDPIVAVLGEVGRREFVDPAN